jgi:hypothetical protein
MRKLWMTSALALSLGIGALGALPAQASSAGRKNTAIGLGAAAVYELVRGQTTAGLVLGAGAAYGYKRYKDAKDDERYDHRYDYDNRGRSRGYNSDRGYYSDSNYRPARHEEYRRPSYDYVRDSRDRYAREDQERCRQR